MRLRAHLGVLILGTLLPMVAFSAAMIVWMHRQTRAATERGLLDTTRAISVAVDHNLGGTVAGLKLLATSEHLRTGNLEAFHQAAREAVATQPAWQNVVLYTPEGRPLVNSLLPPGAPVPAAANSEPVQRAVRTGLPVVSDLFIGRLTNRPLISVVIPVSEAGTPRYALGAILTAAALREILRQQELPADWVATLADRTGAIIARTLHGDQLVGQPTGPGLAAAMATGREGSFRGTTKEGIAVHGAFTGSAVSGWTVAIGVPASTVDGPLLDQLVLLGIVGTVFALLGTVIAGVIGERMAGPLLSLSPTAAKLARGEPIVASKTAVAEVNTVMQAMEAASTERLRIEAANVRLLEETEARRAAAKSLADVGRLISESLDLTTVSERIAESVLTLLGVHSSAIRLLRPDGSLAAIAVGGRAKEYASAPDVILAGMGLAGRVAAEGRPMWTEDIRSDDRAELTHESRDWNTGTGLIAVLAVPLRVAGRVIGVLGVGSTTPRAFTAEDVALLQTFADQAASAINNAQTQEALAKQAERLRILHEIDRALIAEQAPVAIAEAVVRPLRDLLGVPRVIVNLFDFATGEVEWLAAAGRHRIRLGPGIRYSLALAGDVEALRRGEPQMIDVHALPPSPEAEALLASGVHVYMVVPMLAGGELIGSVSFGDAAGPFPPERVSIAQEAATQLAIAIAQARLHERVKGQAEELELRVQERTRELRTANDELGRANQMKSEFLANMSHELRTPLNGIIGFAELMHDGKLGPVSPDHQEYLGDILASSRHLLQLINDVLDLSKVEAGRMDLRPEKVSLAETIREVCDTVRTLAAQKRITIDAEVDASVPEVVADVGKLKQVLYNYLSNALKFTPDGGHVDVRTTAEGPDMVRLEVEDTGIGIREEDLGRLFVEFQQLDASIAKKYAGTGLGLALTKRIVEWQGGHVGVRSTPGKGSTFFAVLRRSP